MIIDTSFYEENHHLLLRLKSFLNYELSSSLLLALSFLSFIGGITLVLANLAATIFIPFMLYVLFKTKKYGWISVFAIIIFIPSVISPFIFSKAAYTSLFLSIELGLFYLYCFVLRLTVNDWCEEINMRNYRLEQMKATEEKEKMFQTYFDNKI